MNSHKLLASGRQADVFDCGPGRILRRYRTARGAVYEAQVMEHARSRGFPVPAVYEASETELVMERIDGPTMLSELAGRPWTLVEQARTLAQLHHALHRIQAPAWLPAPFGGGETLLHLDLHPANVILGQTGPVVIDWPAAARGPGAADVAQTWVLVRTSDLDGPPWSRLVAHLGRTLFLRAFLRHFDRGEVRDQLRVVACARLRDPNVRDSERAAIERLAGG